VSYFTSDTLSEECLTLHANMGYAKASFRTEK